MHVIHLGDFVVLLIAWLKMLGQLESMQNQKLSFLLNFLRLSSSLKPTCLAVLSIAIWVEKVARCLTLGLVDWKGLWCSGTEMLLACWAGTARWICYWEVKQSNS